MKGAPGAIDQTEVAGTDRLFFIDRAIDPRALDLQDGLYLAQSRSGAARRAALADCDAALNRLRVYLRLAHRWRWLSDGQYAHISTMVAEIGRLLGGWIRSNAKPR